MQIIGARVKPILLAAAAIGTFSWQQPAQAAPATEQEYHLPAQDLGSALRAVARISGHEIMFAADAVEGKRAPDLNGRFTLRGAINLLLKGSGIIVKSEDGEALILGRPTPSSAEVTDSARERRDIVVTGSRIRGAPIASAITSITSQQMLDAGQNSLTEAIRTIPQNFGGGQNPGIGLGVPKSENSSGASTINLRGLGGDATLTLLNGHRLAYNIDSQVVDVSSIPFAAIDRIEVVADGASALYGSDAVAGVANIILKRQYDGFSTSARFGASTDGGNVQQQYSAVAGRVWGSGGLIAAYEFERDTPIVARERSYAADRAPGLTLYPFLKHHNALLSGHQDITSHLTFEVDALYNKRWNSSDYALDSNGDVLANGGRISSKTESFAIAPTLKLSLPHGWRTSLSAMYGEDRTNYASLSYFNGQSVYPTYICYCNKAKSIELNADGPLFRLPGGSASIAFGGGYRSNTFNQTNENIHVSQDTYYAFGEISLPFISPEQGIRFLNRLTLSGALRYEDYPGVDRIVTPKLGLIYSPSPDIDIKGSWGKSFKAPTLFQRYFSTRVGLYTAASLGGSGYPANATTLLLLGGNPDLKPERATTWSATFAIHPRAIEGARIEVSYFDIRYRDRVVAPITFSAQALSDPIYRDLVNFNPSDADKAAAMARGTFVNLTGSAYDPSNVVAIVQDTNLNAARQSVHGIDVSAEYKFQVLDYGTLSLNATGSYIHSTQRLSALQPIVNLAGNLFSPPHIRARGGLIWADGSLTASSYVNYIGGVGDVRSTPSVRIGSMTTVDMAIRYSVTNGPSAFRGVDFSLSIQNLFNDKPDTLRNTQVYETPYDSTNYSPIGRFVSFGITKRWW